MTIKENHNDPRSPAELRAAFIALTHEIEAVEHIGRHKRLFGRRQKIAEQLIAAGGNSEREFLPLMYFLAQIHCPDLKGLPGAEILPEAGLLGFFGDHDAIGGCGWVDPSQSAIYHWTELDSLTPADPPLELEARAEQGVVLRPCLDLPDPRSEAAETMQLTAEERPRYSSLYLDALEYNIPAQARGGYCVHNKLLGWPRLVQDDLSLGMETGDRPLRLLLQLDGNFGPGGSVYFLMNSVDLAARRFDRNEFAVQVT